MGLYVEEVAAEDRFGFDFVYYDLTTEMFMAEVECHL